MNTTKQLADALRDAILCVDPDQNPETFECARDALAAYDAQTAGVADMDAFIAKWEWLILSRCRDEFRADLDAILAVAERRVAQLERDTAELLTPAFPATLTGADQT